MVKTGSFFQWVLERLRSETILILLVAGVFFCQGCSATNVSKNTEQKTIPVEDEYIIGPTDILEIHVWREPDLSRTIPVRPDGKITLPLLNDVQASGLTSLELKAEIEKGLDKFVESPTVSVAVQEIHSKNIFVLGQVVSPGGYPLQQDLTVLQALSLAGGLAEWADQGNVVILRNENGKQSRIKFDYKNISKGKYLEKNIVLKPGDTIIVP
ncbi:MAG: polysaccharide biosynthesis/export family protein [Deltaproteobacteria bacterium]|jgi:polysaccharide export outer membrane protein|nr:polysaccharide biosynthesis/export family protein [Deltaproteobacteria bacterium]